MSGIEMDIRIVVAFLLSALACYLDHSGCLKQRDISLKKNEAFAPASIISFTGIHLGIL